MSNNQQISIIDPLIENKIFFIRGEKVMLDRDLAELYGVETKVLNQSVKRNILRFPSDFMFQLTTEEFENWKSQIVISNSIKMGIRRLPYAFTENGIAMLSSVLKSDKAVLVNIEIMRIFTKIRKALISNQDILAKLFELEHNDHIQQDQIRLIFNHLDRMQDEREQEWSQHHREYIGFKK